MKRIVFGFCISFGLLSFGTAHSQDDTDMKAVIGYEPTEVLTTWLAWEETPNTENAYVEAFMKAHDVPQQGEGGLSKHDTWLWWIGHHPDLINQEFLPLEKKEK